IDHAASRPAFALYSQRARCTGYPEPAVDSAPPRPGRDTFFAGLDDLAVGVPGTEPQCRCSNLAAKSPGGRWIEPEPGRLFGESCSNPLQPDNPRYFVAA